MSFKPYQDTQTGVWNLLEMKYEKDVIACELSDDDDNRFPAIVELEVTNFEVRVISVNCTGENLNNAQEDLTNAIREKYKNQVINFN